MSAYDRTVNVDAVVRVRSNESHVDYELLGAKRVRMSDNNAVSVSSSEPAWEFETGEDAADLGALVLARVAPDGTRTRVARFDSDGFHHSFLHGGQFESSLAYRNNVTNADKDGDGQGLLIGINPNHPDGTIVDITAFDSTGVSIVLFRCAPAYVGFDPVDRCVALNTNNLVHTVAAGNAAKLGPAHLNLTLDRQAISAGYGLEVRGGLVWARQAATRYFTNQTLTGAALTVATGAGAPVAAAYIPDAAYRLGVAVANSITVPANLVGTGQLSEILYRVVIHIEATADDGAAAQTHSISLVDSVGPTDAATWGWGIPITAATEFSQVVFHKEAIIRVGSIVGAQWTTGAAAHNFSVRFDQGAGAHAVDIISTTDSFFSLERVQ